MKKNINKNEWCIDSGASNHMTPLRDLLTKIKRLDMREIIIADDSKLNVIESGTASISINGM